MRIGTGFDVHRLVEDRKFILGGVTIPYSLGLLGHSDADVLLHAIMDAMLGALALGDIGKHFPDTDPCYKGASSLHLLGEVNSLCNREGYSVGNADTVIIAEKPKLAPYIEEMRVNIARTLSITADRVSVKATTTEGLGFCGRGEGIAAQATVILTRGQV
ncbi:MAG: 2-C-methyl-D-erythritol 2,4-cyclodiphosphate synthase [Clostridiales bacterium]|jgi:2-C-methyl-D-erythritol 2,4-cyclodiphosphate synthase|nr:2-C-methyl-D-erythritol 2,4-cyclodiphosphate synthase [Clostridiales bacterium]